MSEKLFKELKDQLLELLESWPPVIMENGYSLKDSQLFQPHLLQLLPEISQYLYAQVLINMDTSKLNAAMENGDLILFKIIFTHMPMEANPLTLYIDLTDY